ncbi:MAG: YaeQ family protein [Bdellovibrionales bacterium]|nr:YaeQ family protein [Bdellovibrionales bacterium]
MATTTTLYRFQIELSDIQRAVYENLDFRVAQHPSEHMPYLLTRVLAYALNTQEGLAFSATGLHDPDSAAISIVDSFGGFKLIIEIGSPSARKLHKATKVSKEVKVYTYKSPERFMSELREEKIHRVDEIEFHSFAPEFIEELSLVLKRDNRWSILFNDGVVTVQVGEQSISGELGSHNY